MGLRMEEKLINDDCLKVMKKLKPQSVDLILTDPPYNLGLFMKKRETNLKKMRENYFGAADWDNLEYKDWKKSINKFFLESSKLLKKGGSVIVFMAVIKVES